MSADPVMRARARLFLFNIEQDLFGHLSEVRSSTAKVAEKARMIIQPTATPPNPWRRKHPAATPQGPPGPESGQVSRGHAPL
jgi:hypothetical protein